MSDYKNGQLIKGKGYWCTFCQCIHSARTCFHPGRSYIYGLEADITHLRELLDELYNVSIGLLTIDDDDTDGIWLDRMLKAKKVMDKVHKELVNG